MAHMMTLPVIVTPATPPAASIVGGVAPLSGRRRPATGEAQAKRKAWGRQWGGIVSGLAQARREQ